MEPSFLILDAVRTLRDTRRRREELRQDIQLAIDEMDRGEGTPLDMAGIKRELADQLAAKRG